MVQYSTVQYSTVQPVEGHLAVSVQEDDDVAGGGQGAVVPGPDEPLPLSVTHQQHLNMTQVCNMPTKGRYGEGNDFVQS